ncbi:MAG: Glu-tRNA(Gln) amidotransferase subunit GatD [Candidatus Woesearchaeota archaeon]
MEPKPGTIVKIITTDGNFEGMIIERPELYDKDHITLKLSSGYNIGIRKEKIKTIEIIKEITSKEESSEKITIDGKKIVIISTGGTISSKVDYSTGGVSAKYDAKNFLNLFPELKNYNIEPVPLMNKMSEDFLPEDWIRIAEEVYKYLLDENVEGVILTQGTDTMQYTAAVLSFFIRNPNKPIIITGAQRSIDRPSTDAKMNLICSVIAAKSNIAEIGVVMHGSSDDEFCYWHFGTRVRKMHTSRRDAFRSINSLPIAKIYADGRIEEISKNLHYRSNQKPILDAVFEEKVGMIFVHPNMDPEIIDFFINKKYKGLVIQATALGHVPTTSKKEIFSKIKKAIENGIVVVISTQTLYGSVHEFVYSNLRKLSSIGCIYVKDMLSEVAYVKLGWVLAKSKEISEIKKMMLTPFAKEISEKSNYYEFLN